MEYRYPKQMRLCSKKAIAQLLEKGTVIFHFPFKAYILPAQDSCTSAFCISVPKRNFKRAVKRNRIKRLVREAIRLNQSEKLSNFNANFLLIYVSKEIDDYATISRRIAELLVKSASVVEKMGASNSDVALPDADKVL